jgi:hypothetical protein
MSTQNPTKSPGRPAKPSKRRLHVMIDRKLANDIKRAATKQRRSFSQQLEVILEKAFSYEDFT